ncbi:MAG TPA: hypothetical protein DC057_14450 [Spirochaetia bacterium]|nr:hypothetical protein [Spirochaetia bacterium]
MTGCSQNIQYTVHRNISEHYAYFNDIAVDSKNTIYLSYKDFAHNNRLSVMMYKNNTWEYAGHPAITPLDIYYSTMEMSKDDIPYIAYLDCKFEDRLSVIRYSHETWGNVGSPGISDGLVENISMSIDDEGRIYVAYSDKAHNYKLCVKVFNNERWDDVIKPGYFNGNFQSLSDSIRIVTGKNGGIHLLFIDSSDAYRLKYAVIKNGVVNLKTISEKSVTSIDMIYDASNIYTVHSEEDCNVLSEIRGSGEINKIVYNHGAPAFYNKLVMGKLNVPFICMVNSTSLQLNVKSYYRGKIRSVYRASYKNTVSGMVSYMNVTHDAEYTIYIAFRDHDFDNKAGLLIIK